MAYLYNVYKDEKLILEKATTKEVSELTGCNRNSVSRYAKRGDRVKGIYTVKITGEAERTVQHENDIYKAFMQRYGTEALKQWLFMNKRYGNRGC